MGRQESHLTTIKCQKMSWFGHVTLHNGPCKTIMQCRLLKVDCNARAGQRTSKSGQTWQCQMSWDPLPTDHPDYLSVSSALISSKGNWNNQRSDVDETVYPVGNSVVKVFILKIWMSWIPSSNKMTNKENRIMSVT